MSTALDCRQTPEIMGVAYSLFSFTKEFNFEELIFAASGRFPRGLLSAN